MRVEIPKLRLPEPAQVLSRLLMQTALLRDLLHVEF